MGFKESLKRMEKAKSIKDVDPVDIRALNNWMDIQELEKKSLFFYIQLAFVLLGLQFFIGLPVVVIVMTLVIYTLFVRSEINKQKKLFQKDEYEQLKASAKVTKGKFER